MKKAILIIATTILLISMIEVIKILFTAGTFKTINPHFEGTLSPQTLPIAGPEDITIDPASGIAFISVDYRRTNQNTPNKINGAILVMDMTHSSPTLRNVTPPTLTDFHPHGISLWTSSEGKVYLFAINHRQKIYQHAVERFEWKDDQLIHLESIIDMTHITSPNDLVAIGERSFYVTNDHYYPQPGLARLLEEYLQRAIGFVNFYDGQSFKKVAEDIAYPNGINSSADRSQIYVASTTGRNLLIYDRLPDHSLVYKNQIDLETGVDNIEVDSNGALWIGCHPQLLKFTAHARDATKFSPSQILKVTINHDTQYKVSEVFLNDGTEYSGSTVAAAFKNKILIGSVFEPSLLLWELNP